MKLSEISWLLQNLDTPLERLYTGVYRSAGTLSLWHRGKSVPENTPIRHLAEKILRERRQLSPGEREEGIKIFKWEDESGHSRTCLWLEDREDPGERADCRFFILPLELSLITPLIESYCQHLILTESFGGLFCLLNKYGEIIRINGRGLALLGFGEKDLLGKPLQMILSSPGSFQELEKLIDNPMRPHNLEICLRKKGGDKFIGLASMDQVKDEREDTIYSTLIISDITYQVDELNDSIKTTMELLDSNEYLKKTQTTLLRTEKMAAVGELGAGLAHEINNPLSYLMNNMTLYTEYTSQIVRFLGPLSQDAPLDGKALREEYKRMDMDFMTREMTDMAREMKEGLEHIQKIIHSLKSFSGSERSRGWNYEDINKTIEEMLIISRNRYKYDTEICTELSDLPRVLCHLSELNQALLALFNNSLQAVKEKDGSGKGKVTIRTYMDGKEGGLLIQFENNGPPLGREERDRIFTPFYSNWKTVQGSGMGLTVAQDIVMGLHRGDIRIESGRDRTLFTIFLPMVEELKEGS